MAQAGNRIVSIAIGLTLLAVSWPLRSSEASEAFVEACGAQYRDSSGAAQGFLLPQLSKSLAQTEFVLPPDAPTGVMGVQCGRPSIVPLWTDLKIIAAGFPFTILSGGRIGTLTVVDGYLRFSMSDGEMTQAEIDEVGGLLDKGQQFLLDRENQLRHGAANNPEKG